MMHQRFEMIRTIDPLAPVGAIGYDVANTVAMLFDKIASEMLNPADADLDTLRVQRIDGAVRVSVYVQTDFIPGVDRFSLTP